MPVVAALPPAYNEEHHVASMLVRLRPHVDVMGEDCFFV